MSGEKIDAGAAGAADAGAADKGAAAAAGATGDKGAAAATGGADKGAGDKGAQPIIGGAKDGAAAAATAATAGTDDKGAAADKVVTPDWRDDWRDKLAEQVKPGDKGFRTRLDRFASPADIGKSWLALESKVSAGELKAPATPFPEKGTDEQKAAWRKDQGVPDAPEGYKPELKNGMVVGEADKPIVDAFAKAVHGRNWTQAQFNDALQAYYDIQDQQNQQLSTVDATRHQQTEDALRAEWGADYRRNTTAADNFLGSLPEGLGARLANARLADGTLAGDDPVFIKAITQIALELNPNATLIPGGVNDGGKSVSARLEEIRKFARENPDKYDQDKALQAERAQLTEASLRLQARGKAA